MCLHVTEEEFKQAVEVTSIRISSKIKDPVQQEKWNNLSFDARTYFIMSKLIPI